MSLHQHREAVTLDMGTGEQDVAENMEVPGFLTHLRTGPVIASMRLSMVVSHETSRNEKRLQYKQYRKVLGV